MNDPKPTLEHKELPAKPADLIAGIDGHLDRLACLKVRKELLEEAIAIFSSQPSEAREQMVADWKSKLELHMTSALKQNAEYQSTIDSVPLV